MSASPIERAAERLREAERTGIPCDPLVQDWPDLTVADAYRIQEINVGRRRRGTDEPVSRTFALRPRAGASDPNPVVGWKIGITSRAVQQWLKVDEPDFGTLLADMAIGDGRDVPIARLLQPRAEGELAFVLGKPLGGPGTTAADVLAATEFLLPAIEIVASRVRDWRITIVDTIADNASSGCFVLGSRPVRPDSLDLRLCGMTLRRNGRVVSTGAGAATLDSPLNAVAWLADTLARVGAGPLPAGSIILSGALGPVTPVEAGDHLEVDISGAGRASCRFV